MYIYYHIDCNAFFRPCIAYNIELSAELYDDTEYTYNSVEIGNYIFCSCRCNKAAINIVALAPASENKNVHSYLI